MKTKKPKKWAVQISSEYREPLKRYCKVHGYTISGIVEKWLKEYFAMNK